ncbi:syncytin-2-like [Strix uralensis]|uniref:syncytin-2-like n=1 Tax=Strix uralensis TaxID=36305 RepID=UPI003DA3043B
MTCTLSNHGHSPTTMPALAGFLLGVFGLCWNLHQAEGWVVPQPKQNIWVTLANMTHQETLCLSTANPENPFSTCLVGVPVDTWPIPQTLQAFSLCNSSKNCTDNWDGVYSHLPQVTQEPQELELLGSVIMDACVFFNYSYNTTRRGQNVNATNAAYHNSTAWCNYTSTNISRSFAVPLALPPGVFLICGDCAWGGVPSKLNGGPCSLGRLTLLTPNVSMILNMTRKHKRVPRTVHRFESSCRDNVEFWNPGQIITASILAPGVGVANALTTLNKLGCWLSKQTNATSLALSGLLTDVDSVRHATLQNRAAIDFLLLAQGHGCEDFEGMCCMNLSDHSESIFKSIQQLKDGVRRLTEEDGLDWLTRMFKGWGLSGWLISLVKTVGVMILVIVTVLLMLPCLVSLLQRALQKTVSAIFLAQIQKGGIVGGGSGSASSLTEEEFNLEDIPVYP